MSDILLKGGQVVDPSQRIHEALAIGVKNGKIVALQKEVAERKTRKTLELRGRIVTPGLIDLHTHVYWKGNSSAR